MRSKTWMRAKRFLALLLTVVITSGIVSIPGHAAMERTPAVEALVDWIQSSDTVMTNSDNPARRLIDENGTLLDISYVLKTEIIQFHGHWTEQGKEIGCALGYALNPETVKFPYCQFQVHPYYEVAGLEGRSLIGVANVNPAEVDPDQADALQFHWRDRDTKETLREATEEENQFMSQLLVTLLRDSDEVLADKLFMNMGDLGFTAYEEGIYKDGSSESRTLQIGDCFTVGDISYQITRADAEVSVIGITGDADIIIPAVVTQNGTDYQVTAISARVAANYTGLRSLTIPGSVRKIGKKAFLKCSSLDTIRVDGSALTSVGKNAFKGIAAKTKVVITGGDFETVKNLFSKATKSTLRFK